MEFHSDILYQFLQDLVESYRQQIIEQEELYIQGIKDGLRIAKLIGKAEEGESC